MRGSLCKRVVHHVLTQSRSCDRTHQKQDVGFKLPPVVSTTTTPDDCCLDVDDHLQELLTQHPVHNHLFKLLQYIHDIVVKHHVLPVKAIIIVVHLLISFLQEVSTKICKALAVFRMSDHQSRTRSSHTLYSWFQWQCTAAE